MKLHTILVALGLMVSITLPAAAGTYTEATGQCMANSTTGKDRKELAKWIFVAMSAHPDIRQLSAITSELREQSSRVMGALMTRLVTVDCPNEFRAMVQNEGPDSVRLAFETLGRVAMQELMSDRGVIQSIMDYTRFVDGAKLTPILNPPAK